MTNLDNIFKSRDITLPTKVCIIKATIFPVVMYRYESWTIKKAEHWRIAAFELWWLRTLENPLDFKEIKPVNLKGNQPRILIGKADAEAETPILWPPDASSQLIGKDSDVGKDWRQKKEESSRGWNGYTALLTHGYEFEQTPGNCEGQRSLVCNIPWGRKELDMT